MVSMKMATPKRHVSPLPSPSFLPRSFSRTLLEANALALPPPTAVSLFAFFTPPFEAKALTKDQIVSSLTQVEKTIDEVQEAGSNVISITQQVFETLGNAFKPGFDATVPILKQAGEQALKISGPAISEAAKTAQDAIQGSGINPQPVLTAAKTVVDAAQQSSKVIEVAKPFATSTVDTISSADPFVIVEMAGALFLAYLLVPPIWSVISFSFRGYKGELTPAQTLDMISTRNHFLIDIRSEKDKDKAGVPRLPSNAKDKLIAIPLEELPSKLRGIVRNAKKVEAEITALKISYLKRINKGTNIVILDSYSGTAKIVARALTRLGFKSSWIVADGFSGSRGWLQSRLGTDSYNFYSPEVLSPSRVILAVATRFGTARTTAPSGQKLLPRPE